MSANISPRPRNLPPSTIHQASALPSNATPIDMESLNLEPLSEAEIKVLEPALIEDIHLALRDWMSENPQVHLSDRDIEHVERELLHHAKEQLRKYGLEKPGGPITPQSLQDFGYTIPFALVGQYSKAKTGQYCMPMLPTVCFDPKSLAATDPQTSPRLIDPNTPPQSNSGRTSPEVLRKINAEFGAEVQFWRVGELEGEQVLPLYVPKCKNKDGKVGVCMNSGLTGATGNDFSQQSRAEMLASNYPGRVEKMVLPYANVKRNAALEKLNEDKRAGRPTVLFKDEADAVDAISKTRHLKAAIRAYDNAKGESGAFQRLTPAQQTVLFSRTFHQGAGMHKTKVAQPFYQAAVRGDWEAAAKHLRDYAVPERSYQNRVKQEAGWLLAEKEKEKQKTFLSQLGTR